MNDSLLILGVDATSEFGSVAVRRGGQTLAELQIRNPDGLGPVIIQAIQEVLEKAEVRLEEIDCFASANGPGSFTGVRVGVAVVKGLAEALNKRVAGVSNLLALSSFGHALLRAVVLDARREQVFGAVYDANGKAVVEEEVSTFRELQLKVPFDAEWVGWENGPCEKAGVRFTAAPRWLAVAVAECAWRRGPSGWSDPVALDANYVRRSDAEMFWKDS